MSSSSAETEELVRSFPPPPPLNYWCSPPPPSYRPTEMSTLPPPPPAPFPFTISPNRLEPKLIHIQSFSTCTHHQLDGHNSSAEQKARRKRANRASEPEVEVTFRHYCARCGRTRSKTFQRAHPVESGKEPYPGICSRCIPPGSFVPEVSSSKPKEIEKETEELLIRRRCGNRFSGLFKPRYVDVIRVSRKSESPDRAPVRRRKSDSSERIITVKTQRSYERLRESAKKSDPFDTRGFRVRVRSTSRTRCNEDEEDKPSPKRSPAYQDDGCFAPQDRVIGHVRVVTVIHPQRQEPAEPREPPEPRQPRRPRRSPSPPEWYYRRVRRVATTKSQRNEGRPEIFVDRTGYFEAKPPHRLQRDLEGPNRGPWARGALCQQEDRSPLDKHNPMRGVLQYSRKEKLNRAHDLYGAEAQRYQRFRARADSSSEGDEVQERRVRFAPETRSDGKEAQRRRNDQEEVKDWQEEQRDKNEYKHAKKQVRKGVHEGGGKYELYDVDGHYSEEMGTSDVIQDLQRDFEELPVQSHYRRIGEGHAMSGVRRVPHIATVKSHMKLSAKRLARKKAKGSSSSSSRSVTSSLSGLHAQVSVRRANQPEDPSTGKRARIQGWIKSTSDTAKDTAQQAKLPAPYQEFQIIRRVRDSRDAGLD